jgi:hypothetical protein
MVAAAKAGHVPTCLQTTNAGGTSSVRHRLRPKHPAGQKVDCLISLGCLPTLFGYGRKCNQNPFAPQRCEVVGEAFWRGSAMDKQAAFQVVLHRPTGQVR